MRVASVFLSLLTVLLLNLAIVAPVQAASSSAIRMQGVDAVEKDYAGQSLTNEEFISLPLEGADFTGADLRGAVFNGTVLTDAQFSKADLSDSIFYVSDLTNADLSDAVLTAAILLKSNFRGATVTNADFSYAMLDRDQIRMLCETAAGTNPVTGADTRDSLGCQ